MDGLVFLIAVAISAIDPLLVVAYGAAGWLAPNWRWAALLGPLGGLSVLILLVFLRGQGWSPKPFSVAAQLVACSIGAALVRFAIDAVQRRRAAAS